MCCAARMVSDIEIYRNCTFPIEFQYKVEIVGHELLDLNLDLYKNSNNLDSLYSPWRLVSFYRPCSLQLILLLRTRPSVLCPSYLGNLVHFCSVVAPACLPTEAPAELCLLGAFHSVPELHCRCKLHKYWWSVKYPLSHFKSEYCSNAICSWYIYSALTCDLPQSDSVGLCYKHLQEESCLRH